MRRTLGWSLVFLCLAGGPLWAKPALSSKEFGDLKKQAQRSIQAGDFDTAAGKIKELGRDDSKRAIDFLTSLAKIPSVAVYDAARDALAGMSSEEAQEEIKKTMDRGGATDKLLLVDAMGKRADDFAGEALGIACADKTDEVQRAAITTIKSKKLMRGMDGLIEALASLEKKDPDGLNCALVREALYVLTKESFETAEDWKKFWEPRRSSFQRPTTGGDKPPSDGTARRARPKLFGSEIKSNRLVFVIDVSGSMTAVDPNGGGKDRLALAKEQLTQVIDALGDDVRFTILAYSGVLLKGPAGIVTPPGMEKDGALPPKIQEFEWLRIWSPKLVGANGKAKADAKQFVSELKAEGGTFSLNALIHAFKVDGADTVVLLSDGAPNDHDYQANQTLNPQQILDKITTMNRFRRLVIDTFGFDPDGGAGAVNGGFRRGGRGHPPAGWPGGGPGGGGPGGGPASSFGQFMQDLANQNGGTYTQIK